MYSCIFIFASHQTDIDLVTLSSPDYPDRGVQRAHFVPLLCQWLVTHRPSLLDDTRELFTEMDVEGRGYVTFPQFQQAMQARSPAFNAPLLCHSVFSSIDTDKDGIVSYSDLRRMMLQPSV
ncbi:hypothetical protein KIPB_005181 [Kipferlia bialata]|uniref:EF-hand domain-containing protein n=1 Tax=Kipferlia bialata TaxID=797122 RepID=A0A9K3CVP1_9EUKA|nr:hypothetical protein KIPB_005181 [Kipferlia bialata]|eukprot:g5181.t1